MAHPASFFTTSIIGGEENPYTRAFRREPGGKRMTHKEKGAREPAYSLTRHRERTPCQVSKLRWSS
jgi:hypothetical protein